MQVQESTREAGTVLRVACARAAEAPGFSSMHVVSGAGRDAVYLARVAPAAGEASV